MILISMVMLAALFLIIPAAYADAQAGVKIYADNLSFNVTSIPVNIGYTINDTGTGKVMLEVISANNTSIRNFVCGDKGNGSYNLSWDGKDNNGTAVPAGNYTIRICYYPDNFTINGKWGSTGIGNGQFIHPSSVAADEEGNVYVSDYGNNEIQKFDPSGNFLLKWGGNGDGDGKFNYPAGIAVDDNDNVYVVDLGNSRVQVFTSDGEYLTQWGVEGSEEGQLNMPHGLAIDDGGNVYVADMGNSRIQKFTSTGTYLGGWGGMGRGNGSFISPVGVAVDSTNAVYVTDIVADRVQKFSGDGTYIGGWGSTGDGPTQFNSADGIAIDSSGYVYISDIDNHRIQKFSPDGSLVWSIDLSGIGTGNETSPAGIAVSGSGNVYVTDFSNDDVLSLAYDAVRKNTVIQAEVNITLNRGTNASAPNNSVTQHSASAPVTALNLTGIAGNNSWYMSNVTVTLNASDNSGSGIKLIDYSFDNTTWYTYIAPFNISDEGTATINYYSEDNLGDIEPVKSENIRIDKTPPNVTGYATTDPVANGWYTGTVTVHFTANDTLSGIIYVAPDQTISSNGPGQVVEGIAIDRAGNIGKAGVYLNIDNAPPQTSCTPNGTMGNDGWYRSDVQVNCMASDGNGSGVKTTECSLDGFNWNPLPFTITKEGNVTVYYRSIDEAGNVEAPKTIVVKIDKTPPIIIGTLSTTPVNGWYKGNVTVNFTAYDVYSGIASVTPNQTLSMEGMHQSVTGTAKDNAGNSASTVVEGINIDSKPPVTKCTLSGDGGGSGDNTWYRTDVMATLSAYDATSGVNYTMYRVNNSSYDSGWREYDGPFMIYGEGISNISYYSADNAGNNETNKTAQVRIDQTPPAIYATIFAQPNSSGWYTDTVIVHFTASDGLSGVGSITPDVYLSTNGPNQSVMGYAYDMAGNMNSTTISGINISMNAPVTMCTLNRTLNTTPDEDGWFNSSVLASFSTFNNSGPATRSINYSFDGIHWQKYTAPFIVSTEGNNVLYYYSVNDIGQVEPLDARNIKIDKTPPIITYSIQGGTLVNGWYTQNVTVHFNVTDNMSGIKNVTPDVLLSSDGSSQVVNGTAMDKGGNIAYNSTGGINIDMMPPVTNCTLDGTKDPDSGWYTTNVSITLNATDTGIGVNDTEYSFNNISWTRYVSPFNVSGEGTNTIYYRSSDLLDHIEAAQSQTFKVDTDSPITNCTVNGIINPTGWFTVPARVSLSADDGSGIGVNYTEYSFDNASWITYVTPFNISDDGNYIIYYRSSDRLNHMENVKTQVIKVDMNPPVTSCTVSGTKDSSGWFTSPVRVTLNASDGNGIGVKDIEYSFDNASWTPYVSPFNISDDGIRTIYYWSNDSLGHNEAVKSQTIMIDTKVPVTNALLSGTRAINGWFTSEVNVKLNATDAGTGVRDTEYSFDNFSWTDYINPFNITADGKYTLYYKSSDLLNNTEDIKTLPINIDKTPPVTYCIISGIHGNNGWYTSPVRVTLNASDGNGIGVNSIQYSLDNATWHPYAPFSLSADGIYTIYYKASDLLNNTGAVKTQKVSIDQTPPVIKWNLLMQPTPYNWYNSSVTIRFTATDNMSGIASITPDQTISDNGFNQAVTGYATDNAGNTANVTAAGINIDKQTPNTTMYIQGSKGINGWYTSQVTVTLAATDINNAAVTTYYSINNSGWSTSNPFIISSEGSTTVTYYSVDGAGNVEPVNTAVINIDRTLPTMNCYINGTMGTPGAYRSDVEVSLFAYDTGTSGLASATYSLDGKNWTPFGKFTLSNNGQYNLQFHVSDNAGNNVFNSTSFIIDKNIPIVNSTDPKNNGAGAYVDDNITAEFSEPMDSSSINNSTFTLTSANGSTVSGTVRYTQNGDQYGNVSFKPGNDLEPDATYKATLSSSVSDIAGNRLASPYTWTFTTGNQARNGGNVITLATPTPVPAPENTTPTAAPTSVPLISEITSIPVLLAFIAIIIVGAIAIVYFFVIKR